MFERTTVRCDRSPVRRGAIAASTIISPPSDKKYTEDVLPTEPTDSQGSSEQTGRGNRRATEATHSDTRTRPAIGLDATQRDADIETAVTAVWEAADHDSHVLLLIEASDTRLQSRLQSTDVTVLTVEDPAHVDPVQELTAAGKEMGFPGVLVQSTLEADLRYEASYEAFVDAEAYAVPARVSTATAETNLIAGILAPSDGSGLQTLVNSVRGYVDEVVVAGGQDAGEAGRQAGVTVLNVASGARGAAVRALFEHVDRRYGEFDALVLFDEDRGDDPSVIPALADALSEEEADVVVGRTGRNTESSAGPVNRVGTRVRNSLTLGSAEQADTPLQSGVLALSTAAVSRLTVEDGVQDVGAAVLDRAIRADLGVTVTELDTEAVNAGTTNRRERRPQDGRDVTGEVQSALPEVSASAQDDSVGPSTRRLEIDPQSTAIGLIVTEDCPDAVTRAVLRAQTKGYDVFVAHTNMPESESVRFADHLNATIVTPRESDPTVAYLEQSLTEVVQTHDYEHIIVHDAPHRRIDYERSYASVAAQTPCIQATTADNVDGDVIVGIPAYNEADTIASVVTEARRVADGVVVVDDGSADQTATQAREAGATVVEHDRNRGYGHALKTLFREAADHDVEALVIIDADGQHDPADIPKLLQVVENDADIAIGSRFTPDGETDAPLYRRFGLAVVNGLTNLSMGVIRAESRVHDTQSGFRAYDSQVVERLAEDGDIGNRMSASTDILYHAHQHGYEIEEVGTTVTYDGEGTSTQHPVAHGLTLVQNILKAIEHQRPMTVLGMPGFTSIVVGIGFGYWTIANYISSSTFPVGLALVSVFFTLVGIFGCFTGIILHSLNQHFSS